MGNSKNRFLAGLLRHKIIVALGLFLILGCAGGYMAWNSRQYHRTPEYAFSSLQKALLARDAAAVAQLVDFNALSRSVTTAIENVYNDPEDPDLHFSLKQHIQEILLGLFTADTEAEKAKEAKTKKFRPLPAGFLEQFTQNLTFHKEGPLIFVQSAFHHPIADEDCTLTLLMCRDPARNWRLCGLADAPELVRRYLAAQQKLRGEKNAAFKKLNDGIRQRMDDQLPIQDCTASAGLLDDGTLLCVVELKTVNKGPQNVGSANVKVELRRPDGSIILRRNLNVREKIPVNQPQESRWTIEVDKQSPDGQRLLGSLDLPVTCKARWNTMLLDSGELLYIRAKKATDR